MKISAGKIFALLSSVMLLCFCTEGVEPVVPPVDDNPGGEGEIVEPEDPGTVVEGLPAVWDFYSLGFTNATKLDAQATDYARMWKTGEANPVCYATHGNAKAYVTPVAKEGLFLKSGMTVTLNPSVQACGLLKDDYYEFVIPVKKFKPSTKISVFGATGGAGGASAFWIMEYSSDGETWYQAPGAVNATVKEASATAHFWNTETTVNARRTTYAGPVDDSFHFYSFCCSEIGEIADGNLHLRLRSLGLSGRFDGTAAEKGWTDIKSFNVYLAEDRPNPLIKIISHRGGYLENKLPECSRAALKYTIAHNCMGSECDIMWTKDDDVIVCHPDGNGKVNGLVPKDHTLAEIQGAGKLSNGETVPSLREYLDIVSNTSINPYGTVLWLDVKWVSADLTEKVVNASVRIAKEMGACKYIAFLVKDKYDNYPAMAENLKKEYGIEAAWNGQITAPGYYGKAGWAQVPFGSYLSSRYWPPTTYSDAGVQVSIYQTPGSINYNSVYESALPYYSVLKAIFVNHPIEVATHIIAGGYTL